MIFQNLLKFIFCGDYVMRYRLANATDGNTGSIEAYRINTLYTLNLHDVICQLYLNKAENF